MKPPTQANIHSHCSCNIERPENVAIRKDLQHAQKCLRISGISKPARVSTHLTADPWNAPSRPAFFIFIKTTQTLNP